jgi:hypothetical protein
MIANTATEMAYLFRNKFASVALFTSYVVFCVLKITFPVIVIIINLKCFVIGKPPAETNYTPDETKK